MPSRDRPRAYRRAVYDTYVTQKTRPGGLTHSKAEYLRWADAAQARLAGWLPDDRSTPVLDLGCGPGNMLYLLQRLGYTHLSGVDVSAEQLALARQWCPTATVVQGDVLPFLEQHSASFGLITGFDIIEHFGKEEIVTLLELTAHALRPGGRLILQTPNAASPMAGAVAYGDFTHEWFFTPASLADMLRLAGFEHYEARPSAPYAHGLKSTLRRILWGAIEASLACWNLVEVGHTGGGIFTRVFVATAVKPAQRIVQ